MCMISTALAHAGAIATSGSVGVIEMGLAALAAIVLAALVVLRARRDRDLKIRKAASEGYYDPDAARFGGGGVTAPVESMVDPADQPLAPTFAAPGRTQASRRGRKNKGTVPVSTSPRPVPSFPLDERGLPQGVPAFDPVEAINSRPSNF
jgi:hypothetical protein